MRALFVFFLLFLLFSTANPPHPRPPTHTLPAPLQDEFAATGLDGAALASVDKALDERTVGHNPERLCLLKGGIVYAAAVTTVSPSYAEETVHGGAAGWLRATLARPEVARKYSGATNSNPRCCVAAWQEEGWSGVE